MFRLTAAEDSAHILTLSSTTAVSPIIPSTLHRTCISWGEEPTIVRSYMSVSRLVKAFCIWQR